MSTLSKLSRALYTGARAANTADAILRPHRLPNRAKNILVGRALNRSGIFRKWW